MSRREPLDPDHENQSTYNRFATVHLMPVAPDFSGVQFQLNLHLLFSIWVAPTDPVLRGMVRAMCCNSASPPRGCTLR
jgi:hypothetical protein